MEAAARPTNASRLIAAAGLVAGLAGIGGCGDSGPYPTVKVNGRVLYEDGSTIPAEGISIRFDSLEPPLDAKTHPRPGMATTGPDGAFDKVTTSKFADGIVRGRHKVLLSANDAAGKSLIPTAYNNFDTTPLEVNSADSPFEFRVPKP